MKCWVCKGEVPEYGAILLTVDGDFACSKDCEIKYKRDRDHFFNVILPDDRKYKNWMDGVDYE